MKSALKKNAIICLYHVQLIGQPKKIGRGATLKQQKLLPIKIDWDLTNGPLSKLRSTIRYSGFFPGILYRGSDRWRFLFHVMFRCYVQTNNQDAILRIIHAQIDLMLLKWQRWGFFQLPQISGRDTPPRFESRHQT